MKYPKCVNLLLPAVLMLTFHINIFKFTAIFERHNQLAARWKSCFKVDKVAAVISYASEITMLNILKDRNFNSCWHNSINLSCIIVIQNHIYMSSPTNG